MSREGYPDTPIPKHIPEVLYINSYPNNYIFHNRIQIDQQIQREKEIRRQNDLQIQKMENEIKQEKQKKSIWKKFCMGISCIFCCCVCI